MVLVGKHRCNSVIKSSLGESEIPLISNGRCCRDLETAPQFGQAGRRRSRRRNGWPSVFHDIVGARVAGIPYYGTFVFTYDSVGNRLPLTTSLPAAVYPIIRCDPEHQQLYPELQRHYGKRWAGHVALLGQTMNAGLRPMSFFAQAYAMSTHAGHTAGSSDVF